MGDPEGKEVLHLALTSHSAQSSPCTFRDAEV